MGADYGFHRPAAPRSTPHLDPPSPLRHHPHALSPRQGNKARRKPDCKLPPEPPIMGTKSKPSNANKGRIMSIKPPANPLKTYGQSMPGDSAKPRQK